MLNTDLPLELNDGTPVHFLGVTSKGNIQVRLPASHYLADEDDTRIFRPDGSHYKDNLFDDDGYAVTLRNAAPTSTGSIDTGDTPFVYVEKIYKPVVNITLNVKL